MRTAWRIERETVGVARNYPDLEAVDVGGMDRFSLYKPGPYACSKPLVFKATRALDALSDYPFTTNRWPVFSARAAATFGDAAATFPVLVALPNGRMESRRFVLCTAASLVDGLDMHASETRAHYFNPEAPRKVRKPVFRTDVDWPRLFRVQGYPLQAYVNGDAKHALEALGARGVGFYPLATA
ncbi:MAG: hypothetical protein AB8I08_13140 [Sandaracinaceae bacterium]